MTDQPVRPRFGELRRGDGTVAPLVFHPTDDPDRFVAVHAGSEEPVRFTVDDQLVVDVLGPGQSVTLGLPDGRISP